MSCGDASAELWCWPRAAGAALTRKKPKQMNCLGFLHLAETVSAGIAFKGAQRQQKNSHKLLIFMDVSFKFVQSISKEVSR